MCENNVRHSRRHFFFSRCVLRTCKRVDVQNIVWILYYFLHRTPIRDVADHLDGLVTRKTVTRIYALLFERVHMEELMNMLVDPLITGDVEADETWIKAGPKYPGRGRPVSRKHSMVTLTPCEDPRLVDRYL